MPQLQVLSGNRQGFVLDVTESDVVDVGNRKTAKLSIRDPWISWNHAKLTVESGKWVLEDVGSSNGTWVNGEKVKRKELKANDVIHFGKTKVKFVGAGGAAAPTPAAAAPSSPPAAGATDQPWWDKAISTGAAGGADAGAIRQIEGQLREERRMREALEKFLDLPRGASVGDVARAGATEQRVKDLERQLEEARAKAATATVDTGALEKLRQEHARATIELEAKASAAEARALGLEQRLARSREKADEELAEVRQALEEARRATTEMSSGGDAALAAARAQADAVGKELETWRQRAHAADQRAEELRAEAERPKADPAETARLSAALAEAQAEAARWEEEHKKVVQEIDEISMEQIEIEDGLKAEVRALKARLGEVADDSDGPG